MSNGASQGVLWLIYGVFGVMKGRWVQVLNVCLSLSKAARLVSHVAGAIVVIEIGVMIVLEYFHRHPAQLVRIRRI